MGWIDVYRNDMVWLVTGRGEEDCGIGMRNCVFERSDL